MGCVRAVLGFLGALLATAALAQYPVKPIRMVAPFPAGGALDVVGRIIAVPMSQSLGQPVVVENRPGADGAIAADHVAKSAADGYTLFLVSYTVLSALPNIRKNIPFDPIGDFTPISSVGKLSFFLAVHPSLPASKAEELIRYARANPGKLNYGSANATSMLGPALLASFAGLDMHAVPYKGEALALNDLLSGRLQLMFISGTLLPHVKDGKLRALATTLDSRSPLLPKVPTMVEAGLPPFPINPWIALVAPAKMPKDIVERLSRETNAALRRPEVRTQLDNQAFEAVGSTPGEMGAVMRQQLEAWRRTISELRIKID
ncbi:MAG TPA: tripartite tricarboxylate transporter substrate binding protein [Burkholderiales bacterium]|nr:tripartite tricarboxylate transporter substrate binding protein [Burkholderiales bacterium]